MLTIVILIGIKMVLGFLIFDEAIFLLEKNKQPLFASETLLSNCSWLLDL